MSDFLTRLVERQAGAAAVVQPRTPSIFAPPVSGTAPAGLPVCDSLSPVDETSRTRAVSLRSGDHGHQVLSEVDQQERQQPVSDSRSTPRAGEPNRTESAPLPLVRNASAVVNWPAHEAAPSPRASSVSIHKQTSSRQMEPTEQKTEGLFDSAPVPLVVRIESPPRLVEAHHATTGSSAAAPPSLASGTVAGRRMEPSRAASTEPPVEVTIGRIEVTAVSAAPDTKRKVGARRPAMSLDEYLSRRQGGRP